MLLKYLGQYQQLMEQRYKKTPYPNDKAFFFACCSGMLELSGTVCQSSNFWFRSSNPSVFQTSDRHDGHPVSPLIGIFPDSCKDHQERRGRHFCRVDLLCQRFQIGGSFIDISGTAQLDLNQAIGAVLQMNDRITFQIISVAVMVNASADGIGINTQIPDCQRFKKKPESIEVVHQVQRAKAQGCDGNGRIGKIPGLLTLSMRHPIGFSQPLVSMR